MLGQPILRDHVIWVAILQFELPGRPVQLTGNITSTKSLDMLYLRYLHASLQYNGQPPLGFELGTSRSPDLKPPVLIIAPQRHM